MLRRKDIIFLLISISLGICGLFYLSGLTLILLIIYVWGLFFGIGFMLSSIYLGRKALKLGIYLIIPIMTNFISKEVLLNYRQMKATKLISQLDSYYLKNGNYPKKIDSTFEIRNSWLSYSSTSDNQTFSISFFIGGLTEYQYDSKRDSWFTIN
ncbi:hypothetical protein ACFSQD_19625 [Flavihumibacter stibioxidans]|jgi:hypothetical protein|uniref:DUF4131 domain-containing protein n=2 Tax=Flavihumibacter stibioxidans TaxID=1834163 RepID=A0ABR7M6M0_9BACT|nr:hypothetical protein [Flavihumibacter stibioxidans]